MKYLGTLLRYLSTHPPGYPISSLFDESKNDILEEKKQRVYVQKRDDSQSTES